MHFLRSICGILKETLIINSFGFNKEEAVTCFDVVVTIMEHKYKIRLTHKKNKEKINQATTSSNEATTSSSNNTDQVRFFCFRNNVIILYMQLNIFTGRGR